MGDMAGRDLLLVDDDTLVLATFGKGLKAAGFGVRVAASGEEAMELARRDPPDLAILDVRMPGLSGVETAALMQELGIAVMFLSAYDDREFVEGAVQRGALGYLVKPIEAARAVPSIEAALQRSRDIRELEHKGERLSGALDTGNLVNVALGILMERHHISQQEAFEQLRLKARSERRKVRDVAGELLSAWHTLNLLKPK